MFGREIELSAARSILDVLAGRIPSGAVNDPGKQFGSCSISLHARTFLAVLSERGFRAAARDLEAVALNYCRTHQATRGRPCRAVVRAPDAELLNLHLKVQRLRRLPAQCSIPLRAAGLFSLKRVLRVASSSNVGTYLLQSMLASFQARDSCSVDLWIGPNPDVAERLTNGTADVALMEWWSERPGFCGYTWRKEPVVVIVGSRSPMGQAAHDRGKRTWQVKPFWEAKPGTGTNTLLKKTLGTLAEGLTAIGGFGNTEAVKRAVRAGRGVSLVIAAAVADEVEAGQLVALRINGNRTRERIEDHFTDRFAGYGACRRASWPTS